VERGRRFLESLVGEAVQFRLVEYEDPERAMERLASSAERPAADAVPPAIEAQVAVEFYEKHYRGWLDEAIPALGNRTPAKRRASSARPAQARQSLPGVREHVCPPTPGGPRRLRLRLDVGRAGADAAVRPASPAGVRPGRSEALEAAPRQ
jgi:hypothetical protein